MLPPRTAVRPGRKCLMSAPLRGQGVPLTSDLQWKLRLANDLSQRRTRALLRDLEMNGGRNSLITCASPRSAGGSFAGYFDAIQVDAPCSVFG